MMDDSIYVVTDGLPTQGKGRRCENDNLISGECRRLIFFDSINLLKKANKRIKINFILLPIEGDIMGIFYLMLQNLQMAVLLLLREIGHEKRKE